MIDVRLGMLVTLHGEGHPWRVVTIYKQGIHRGDVIIKSLPRYGHGSIRVHKAWLHPYVLGRKHDTETR